MDNSRLVLGLLHTAIGRSKPSTKGNHAFHCPFCKHHKPKLEVNLVPNSKGENFWHCWVCNKGGYGILSLYKKAQKSLFPEEVSILKDIFKF